MLRYLTGAELETLPHLSATMFKDRASQFVDRLKWDVRVTNAGEERDEYDRSSTYYVIWQMPDGRHGGSMRFLPTLGPTMLADHFPALTQGVSIRHTDIWECTRFCVSPSAPAITGPALMLGGLDFGLSRGLSHAVGVFNAPMLRVYRRLGWSPALLGTQGEGREAISAGLWDYDPNRRGALLKRAGLGAETADAWLKRDLPPSQLSVAV